MKILITGNLGYIGPSFVKEIRSSQTNPPQILETELESSY